RFYPEPFIDILPSLIATPYPPFVACYLVYFAGCECFFGATLGKYVMGLRVVMDGGHRPTLWAALVRNLVGMYERQLWMLIVAARRHRPAHSSAAVFFRRLNCRCNNKTRRFSTPPCKIRLFQKTRPVWFSPRFRRGANKSFWTPASRSTRSIPATLKNKCTP